MTQRKDIENKKAADNKLLWTVKDGIVQHFIEKDSNEIRYNSIKRRCDQINRLTSSNIKTIKNERYKKESIELLKQTEEHIHKLLISLGETKVIDVNICGEQNPDHQELICRLPKDHHGFCEGETTAYLPIQKGLTTPTIIKKSIKWVGC